MWLSLEERQAVQERYMSPTNLGRRSTGTRAHPETLKWQWAANQILARKHTLSSIHTHAFCNGKMGEKTFFSWLDREQTPLVPLQRSSWARFHFKGMCNLSRASRISVCLELSTGWKLLLWLGQGIYLAGLPCCPHSFWESILGTEITVLWHGRKDTISGEDQSDQLLR